MVTANCGSVAGGVVPLPGAGAAGGVATISDRIACTTTPLRSTVIRLALTVAAAENSGFPAGVIGIVAFAAATTGASAVFTRPVNGPDNAPEKAGARSARRGVESGVMNPG